MPSSFRPLRKVPRAINIFARDSRRQRQEGSRRHGSEGDQRPERKPLGQSLAKISQEQREAMKFKGLKKEG